MVAKDIANVDDAIKSLKQTDEDLSKKLKEISQSLRSDEAGAVMFSILSDLGNIIKQIHNKQIEDKKTAIQKELEILFAKKESISDEKKGLIEDFKNQFKAEKILNKDILVKLGLQKDSIEKIQEYADSLMSSPNASVFDNLKKVTEEMSSESLQGEVVKEGVEHKIDNALSDDNVNKNRNRNKARQRA